MSPTSALTVATTPAYGATSVENDDAVDATPACAVVALACACAALYCASACSIAARLMYCFSNRRRLRSKSFRAASSCACAAATCAWLDASWSAAVRGSRRTSTCPALTVSPARTRISTMRAGTCAAIVLWRTASTTPSAV